MCFEQKLTISKTEIIFTVQTAMASSKLAMVSKCNFWNNTSNTIFSLQNRKKGQESSIRPISLSLPRPSSRIRLALLNGNMKYPPTAFSKNHTLYAPNLPHLELIYYSNPQKPQNLKKILRKFLASDAWPAISENAGFC